MISKSSVGTPYEFITAITDGGARCPHADFADNEAATPKSKLDFFQKAENYRREYVEYLAKAAVAVGVDGLFMETHPCPDCAWSDGPNMVQLDNLKKLLQDVITIDKIVRG